MKIQHVLNAIYLQLLGRNIDQNGLDHWESLYTSGMNIEDIYIEISRSEECKEFEQTKNQSQINHERIKTILIDAGLEPINVVDIGAQILDEERHIYAPLNEHSLIGTTIGFEPLEEKATQRNNSENNVSIRPSALGDGTTQTLYVNNIDATSSMYPINKKIMGVTEGLINLYTVDEIDMKTTRLDEIDLPESIDFLKLDVQGFEYKILENGINALNKTLCIFTEVEFQEIYSRQPLFSDVDCLLRDNNFDFHDLLFQRRLAPEEFSRLAGPEKGSKLMWGDAVYFKSDECVNKQQLLKQAAIAHFVFGWNDLTFGKLKIHDYQTGENTALPYLDALHKD